MSTTTKPKKGKKKGKKSGFQLSEDVEEVSAAVAPPVPSTDPASADSAGSATPGASTTAAAAAAAGSPVPTSPPAPPTAGAGAPKKEGVAEFASEGGEKMSCRFYRKDFPDVDDVVVVYVKSFKRDDPGAIAELLEYDGLEGMILTSELSKRRIRSVYKLLTVGSTEAVKVLRVDREKGYIDLSKRQADSEEKEDAMAKFVRSKSVNIILLNAARKLDLTLDTLYETIAWPLADKFGHAMNGFQEAVKKPSVLTSLEGVTEETARMVRSLIMRRLAPRAVQLSVSVQMTCFEEIGIEALRQALLAARGVSTDALKVAVKVEAAPHYLMTTSTADTVEGEKLLQAAIQAAKASLTANGGKLVAGTIVIPQQDTLGDESGSDAEN